jgi:histidine triad (HIT) family protein
MKADCVFCKIVNGELPSKKRYETEDVLAFDSIDPLAPVHVLIVPKKHIENLSASHNADLDILGKCQLAARDIAKRMKVGGAFRLITASGYGGGQRVFHLHYHLVGGWKTDKDMIVGVKPE